MPDDKKPDAKGKKKERKTAAIVGVAALGAGVIYILWKQRAGGSASNGTTSAGSPGVSGTDMGSVVQTVQGPPGPAGPAGPPGKSPKPKKKPPPKKKPKMPWRPRNWRT